MRGHYVKKKHKHAQASLAWDYVPEKKETVQPPNPKKRTMLLATMVALLVGLLVFAVYIKVHQGVSTDTQISAAEKQLLSDAAIVLASEKPAELKENVTKIQAYDTYTKSPDLLYVALQYYIAIGDPANARKTFDQLQKVFDASKGFSAELDNGTKTIDSLRGDVEFLEAQTSQYNTNAKELPIL